jgi:MOSC domain-containing protein YiiM
MWGSSAAAASPAVEIIDWRCPSEYSCTMETEPSSPSGKLLGIARRKKPRDAMEIVAEVLVTKESGVDGDYHGREPGRQVTVISAEAWKDACTDLGVEVPWTARRANLMLGEIDLCDSLGARISIGDLVLEIVEENPPCRVMDIQRQGLRSALKPGWRAGVACNVVSGGEIRVGDSARLLRI